MNSWNVKLYDKKHQFVSTYGKDVLHILAPQKGEKILDLGCGTGDLSNEISSRESTVIGIDGSESMIKEAKKKFPHITFYLKDILSLDYENEFDAVFSNAVLHWVKSPKKALHVIYSSLKHGGRFVAEFGGNGNVRQITDTIIKEKENLGYISSQEGFPWYFPSIGEYTSLMEQAGFHVIYAEHIDRPTRLEGKDGLKNWIDMFATSFFNDVKHEDKKIIIDNIESTLENELFHDDFWMADYKRIRVMGIKH